MITFFNTDPNFLLLFLPHLCPVDSSAQSNVAFACVKQGALDKRVMLTGSRDKNVQYSCMCIACMHTKMDVTVFSCFTHNPACRWISSWNAKWAFISSTLVYLQSAFHTVCSSTECRRSITSKFGFSVLQEDMSTWAAGLTMKLTIWHFAESSHFGFEIKKVTSG